MQVRDTGGWWRIVIDCGAKPAKFCLGEGERGAIPTSASTTYVNFVIFWRWLKTDLRLRSLTGWCEKCGRLPGGLPVISPSFATGSEDSRPRRTTRGQPERGNGSLGKRKPVLPLAGTITRARILRIEQPQEVKH